MVVTGANVHDTKLLEMTFESIVVGRPDLDEEAEHLRLDKGHDNPTGHQAVASHGYRGHIRRIGEEKLDTEGVRRYPARRWVVERTLAWLSKCRAILVRYDNKVSNYIRADPVGLRTNLVPAATATQGFAIVSNRTEADLAGNE